MLLSYRVFHRRLRFDSFGLLPGQGGADTFSLFTERSTGFQVTGSHPVSSFSRVGVSYSLDTNKVYDIREDFRSFAVSQLVLLTTGGTVEEALTGIVRSQVTPFWTYDTRNRFLWRHQRHVRDDADAGSRRAIRRPDQCRASVLRVPAFHPRSPVHRAEYLGVQGAASARFCLRDTCRTAPGSRFPSWSGSISEASTTCADLISGRSGRLASIGPLNWTVTATRLLILSPASRLSTNSRSPSGATPG